jgi:hypothetical protein
MVEGVFPQPARGAKGGIGAAELLLDIPLNESGVRGSFWMMHWPFEVHYLPSAF